MIWSDEISRIESSAEEVFALTKAATARGGVV